MAAIIVIMRRFIFLFVYRTWSVMMSEPKRTSLITATGCSPKLVEGYRLVECFLCAMQDSIFYYETH